MSEPIKGFQTDQGIKKYDYESLVNLPNLDKFISYEEQSLEAHQKERARYNIGAMEIGDYATKTEAQGYASEAKTIAQEAKEQASSAVAEASSVRTIVEQVQNDLTVVQGAVSTTQQTADASLSKANETAQNMQELQTFIGEIPSGDNYVDVDTIVEYIDKKAEETLAAAGSNPGTGEVDLTEVWQAIENNSAEIQNTSDSITQEKNRAESEESRIENKIDNISKDYLKEEDKTYLHNLILENAQAIEDLENRPEGGGGASAELIEQLIGEHNISDASHLDIREQIGVKVYSQEEAPEEAKEGELWLDLDEEASGSGSSADIPTFNLTEMGLPMLSLDGTWAEVETDTTALRAALASGLIKVTLNVYFNGYPVTVTAIDRAHYVDAEDTYQVCTMLHTIRNGAHYMHLGVFNIHSTYISACVLPVAQEGKIPVRGEDYWTEEDKAEIISAVLAALPTWTGGSY